LTDAIAVRHEDTLMHAMLDDFRNRSQTGSPEHEAVSKHPTAVKSTAFTPRAKMGAVPDIPSRSNFRQSQAAIVYLVCIFVCFNVSAYWHLRKRHLVTYRRPPGRAAPRRGSVARPAACRS
jgi:hypothetical protein